MSDSEHSDTSIYQDAVEEKIKKLKCKRGVCKRKLTLFKKFLDQVDKSNLTAEGIIDIKLRLEQLPILYKDFSSIQDRIETLCSESDDIDTQSAERESFENLFYRLTAIGKVLVQEEQKPIVNESKPQPYLGESIKYPEINLPSYSGDVTQWLQFRDTFDALVNQGNLPPIVKYKYLRSCLQGGALEVISSLDFSDEGYALAWQMLCERYNNPRRLVSNHMRALFDIESVSPTPSALRGLNDNISKHLRSLRSLNVPTENWDLMIIYVLANKLDSHIRSKWENSIDSRKLPSLQEFRLFLRNRADRLEAAAGSVVQLDVGTDSKKAMVTTSEAIKIGENLYTALQQFLIIFPELRKAPLTIAGESYAGKHIPSIGIQILKNREKDRELPINLQGLAIGNGFIDPYSLMRYSFFVREAGLVDDHTADSLRGLELAVTKSIDQGDKLLAFHYYNYILNKIEYAARLNHLYNFLRPKISLGGPHLEFLKRSEVRRALHVGDTEYGFIGVVYKKLIPDMMNSAKMWLEELLDNYRVMLYNGHLDIIVAYHPSVNTYNSLTFSGSKDYRNATRRPWYHGYKLAGYYKTAGNLTEVMVLGAGHMVPAEKPAQALGLITAFARGLPLYNTGRLVDLK